jgi:hypothetical protein
LLLLTLLCENPDSSAAALTSNQREVSSLPPAGVAVLVACASVFVIALALTLGNMPTFGLLIIIRYTDSVSCKLGRENCFSYRLYDVRSFVSKWQQQFNMRACLYLKKVRLLVSNCII